MVFEIDGTDITPYIHFEGLKYTTFDLDSEETTRTLDGNLRRSRVATKVRWDVPCKRLRTKEVEEILRLLKPECSFEHRTPCSVFVWARSTPTTTLSQ